MGRSPQRSKICGWVWSKCAWGDVCDLENSYTSRLALLHKPRCPEFSTPLAMDSFLYSKSRIHVTFLSPSTHQILSLPSSFSPSIPPFLCSMPYISSESASHSPPLHCHILYTSSPPSLNLSLLQRVHFVASWLTIFAAPLRTMDRSNAKLGEGVKYLFWDFSVVFHMG